MRPRLATISAAIRRLPGRARLLVASGLLCAAVPAGLALYAQSPQRAGPLAAVGRSGLISTALAALALVAIALVVERPRVWRPKAYAAQVRALFVEDPP